MSQEINCQIKDDCTGHAVLPGGKILEIDGKRACWACAVEVQKKKEKCVRVRIMDLQTVYDLLFHDEAGKAMVMLKDILREKGVITHV